MNNLEQVQAIMEAADETDSPVILQASRGARSYAGEIFLRHLILAATETYPHIPVVMHQDHGNALTPATAAINGFTSVMMDGSLKPTPRLPPATSTTSMTKQVVDFATRGCERGELGCLPWKPAR